MRSPLATLFLLSSFSLATQAACVDDITLQIFQDFALVSSAYCTLFQESEALGYVPSFAEPWQNEPASISSACSCLHATSFSTSPTSASKCVASATTVTSISTITKAASTIVSTRTIVSTLPASTVTATSQVFISKTLTAFSTLVNTVTNTKYGSLYNTVTDTEYDTLISTATEIDYSTLISATTETDYDTVISATTEIDSVTVTSLTESFITTTIVGSASTTPESSISSSSPSSSSQISTSVIPTSSTTSVTSSSAASSSSSTSANICTATAYSRIAPAVAACTQITLQDIAVPDGDSINLSALKAGSVVTFAGTTTFGYVNSSSFNPITIGGAGITIQGATGSIIDGNGQAYWDGQGSNGGVPKPDHFVVLSKVTANSVIKNLYIRNYPVHCFYISSCSNLVITNIQLDNSAGNAPNAISGGLAAAHNTDGFDISTTTNMVLSNSIVNNQDDCVAITSGNYITVSGMYCNGGHGLSIGSVGGKSNNNVTNILFTDSTVANSQNAARIKSNYNTTGFISNVTYSNIAVVDVSIYGIDIQQDYLNGGPTGIPSNGVTITGITLNNVTGSAIAGAQDYYILCGSGSCSDFTFNNVNIVGGTVADSCNYPPSGCPGSGGSAATSTVVGSSTSSTVPTSTPVQSSSAPSSTSSSIAPISTVVSPYAQTSPVAGAVIVDATGATPSSYLTFQAGVNALSLTSTTPQNIFIYPGTYTEQVYIPALKSNLTVQGYTLDGSSYAGNQATITYNLALLNTTSDDLTATVRQWNPNTKFYNLNIANTFGHVSTNGQNLALSAHTGNQGYYGVQLWGYQDTLLSNTGNQLYSKSLIVGAIDFIFGQTATAWFDQVDIRTIATGCVTASGRASATNPSWYVINNSTVAGINSSIAAGTNFLGRPWEQFARVVFQDTYLSDVIAPAGWRPWSTAVGGVTNTQNVTFAEYDNYGPGSILEEGPRANYSEQLAAPITIETVLGSGWLAEWWVDHAYMVR